MTDRGAPGRRARSAGFTLLEAIVALTISTVVVLMVMSTFLAQNDFYTQVVRRSEVQETVRSAAEGVLAETRGVTQGGVVVADSLRMVVRVPLAMAAVCAEQGNETYVHLPVPTSEIDSDDVTGIAVRDDALETWTYYAATWSSVLRGSGSAASRCYDEGADTVGARDEYQTLRLSGVASPRPEPGEVIMIYHEEEFTYATSELDPATRALFRGPYGGTLTEFATGMSPDAHFRYRIGNPTYVTSVTGTWLDSIDGIRVMAAGRSRPDPDGNTYDYDLTVSIPLRNAPE